MLKRILVGILALALVSSPVACQPYNGYSLPTTFPAATVSRAKFPKVNPKLIDELAYINRYINASITYVPDQDQYGTGDLWIMDPISHEGDCEDYALSKWSMIQQVNDRDVKDTDAIEAIDGLLDIKIVTVIVDFNRHDGQGVQQEGHAILAVLLPDKSVAYLDLNNEELMTRKELTRWSVYGTDTSRYEFKDWKG